MSILKLKKKGENKMYNAFLKDIKYESEDMKFYLQEELILEVTECIAEMMQKKNVSRSDLAKKLGRTKGYITQLLNGNANMTLKTISDCFWALDSTLKINAEPANIDYGKRDKDEAQYDIPESKQCYSVTKIRLVPESVEPSKMDAELRCAG